MARGKFTIRVLCDRRCVPLVPMRSEISVTRESIFGAVILTLWRFWYFARIKHSFAESSIEALPKKNCKLLCGRYSIWKSSKIRVKTFSKESILFVCFNWILILKIPIRFRQAHCIVMIQLVDPKGVPIRALFNKLSAELSEVRNYRVVTPKRRAEQNNCIIGPILQGTRRPYC